MTGFPFAYDVVMSGLWHSQSKTTDGSAPLGTVGMQVDLRRLGTIAGVRGTAAARARRRLRPVDDGRVPIVLTRTTRGEVIATDAVVPSALGGKWKYWVGGSPARKPAQ